MSLSQAARDLIITGHRSANISKSYYEECHGLKEEVCKEEVVSKSHVVAPAKEQIKSKKELQNM